MSESPFFSIIIPVYNGGEPLRRCLQAVRCSDFTDWELLVVDDGSTDGSAAVAVAYGARLLKTAGRLGPAAARNLGGRAGRGKYLYFIDADCQLQPQALAEMACLLQAEPDLEAGFGSYDDAPAAANFISQYKNLFHHYVHQHSRTEAATFWTGCGAIRRARFLALGGFAQQRFRRPSVEDIDLGYRLRQAGGRIRLAGQVQVKHLKTWNLVNLLKVDILDRGIPWTQLILRHRAFKADLNLQTHNRVSVAAVYALLAMLLLALFQPQAVVGVPILAGLLLALNLDLYRFFYQKRGLWFALRVIPLHWLYYLYNAVSFGGGLLLYWQEWLKAETGPPPQALVDGLDTDGT